MYLFESLSFFLVYVVGLVKARMRCIMTEKKSFRQHLKMVEEKKLNLDVVVIMVSAKTKLVGNSLLCRKNFYLCAMMVVMTLIANVLPPSFYSQ